MLVQSLVAAELPEPAAISRRLHREISTVLKQVEPRIWHAMPVWFIDDNPVVGYKASAT
jgi:hypothetical protein